MKHQITPYSSIEIDLPWIIGHPKKDGIYLTLWGLPGYENVPTWIFIFKVVVPNEENKQWIKYPMYMDSRGGNYIHDYSLTYACGQYIAHCEATPENFAAVINYLHKE